MASERVSPDNLDPVLDTESDFSLGHQVTIPAAPPGSATYGQLGGANASAPIDAVWCAFKRPAGATVTLQAAAANVYATVRTYVGSALFVRGPFLVPQTPRSIRVFGKMVIASFQQTNQGATNTASAAITPEDVNPLGDSWPVWTPSVGSNATGVIDSGPGGLISAQGCVIALGSPDTQYWLMFFDAAAVPAPGTSPLLAIGPITPGEAFGFDQEARPQVFYSTGLCWALSTTPITYTAASAGAEARVDVGTAK